MVEFLKSLREDQRERLKDELRTKTVDLASALGRRVEYDEVVPALKKGFEETWHIRFDTLPKEGVPEVVSVGVAPGS
jgi:hypothetical protein